MSVVAALFLSFACSMIGAVTATLFCRRLENQADEKARARIPRLEEGIADQKMMISELRTEIEESDLWASRQYQLLLQIQGEAVKGLQLTGGTQPYREEPKPGRAEFEQIEELIRSALDDVTPDTRRFIDEFLVDEEGSD